MRDKADRMQRTLRKHKQRKKYNNFAGVNPNVCLETPKRSSTCRCCSNPRKNEKGKDKLTMQERKYGD